LGASKLVIAVRSIGEGEVSKKSIEQSTKYDPKVIEVWSLDLGSYANIKAFAARASSDLPRIDVLLENAGVTSLRWDWAADNEMSLTVNVVSTLLLFMLLLPTLKDTAIKFNTGPTLTIVTSDTHFLVDFTRKGCSRGNLQPHERKEQREHGRALSD
ncbi:hypothetical protein MMC15_007432, partial [Xylographa vitiligo]|nr:hypothetical protein [Xylographa vitiligo]